MMPADGTALPLNQMSIGGGNPSTTLVSRTPAAAAAPNVIGWRISDQANAGFQVVLQQPQVERGRHLVPYTGR